MWWHEPASLRALPRREPLERFTALNSSDLDEAREFIGSIFCPHRLRPITRHRSGRGADIRVNHVPMGSISLNYLKYGAHVEVEPGHLTDFFLVQLQLSGTMSVDSGSQAATVCAGQAAVLSPSEHTRMIWSEDSAEVVVRLERLAVERRLTTLLGSHLPDPLVFDVSMDCETGPSASWCRTVRFLVSELELSDNMMTARDAMEQFEESLICSLLYSQKHNYTRALHHGMPTVAPRHVKLAEEYIHANLLEPITIEDLAMASGVSVRSLFAGFKQFRGTSPMKYLRHVRLKQARTDLENANPEATVTNVAMKWGFYQLGRFAVEYRKTFGELPSETIKRAAFR